MISEIPQAGLIISALIILLIGGLFVGRLSLGRGNLKGMKYSYLADRQSYQPQTLYIHPFVGDQYGSRGEMFVTHLRQMLGLHVSARFVPRFWMTLWGRGKLGNEITLSTGAFHLASHKTEAGEKDVIFAIDGEINETQFQVNFFPSQDDTHGYSSSDFPLNRLKNLTQQVTTHQKVLIAVSVVGWLARHRKNGEERLLQKPLLKGWGRQLERQAHLIKVTQSELAGELFVGAAWCFLQYGLKQRDVTSLERSLALYDLALSYKWRNRDEIEWACLLANRCHCALALGELSEMNDPFYSKVLYDLREASRPFRGHNFDWRAGSLFVLAAEAQERQAIDCMTPEERRFAERGLDEAIAFWHTADADEILIDAYIAKGKLSLQVANVNMGMHDWEAAENSLLSALSVVKQCEHVSDRQLRRVRFELSQLYLSQASRFGNTQLLEKAVHYLRLIKDQNDEPGLEIADKIELSMALCNLHLGGINNDTVHLKRAIHQLNDILDGLKLAGNRKTIERYLCVARARLALITRERDQVKLAISQLSAVLGHNGDKWPTHDVLLRLRARLQSLQFSFEGDGLALDRAIRDRRALVDLASSDRLSLRFAFEVGELVGLLSKRQYRLDEQNNDFHEAHYFLERALEVCKRGVFEETPDHPSFEIPHIEAGLHLKMAELLASFARVKRDEKAVVESAQAFEAFLNLSPRSSDPIQRAVVLNEIGQLMMDRSEQFGHHNGLIRAAHCFAEAYDIYLNHSRMDQANRQRRFLENAEAAIVAYNVPHDDPFTADNVVMVRPNVK